MTGNLEKDHDCEQNSHCSVLCRKNEAEGIETLGYTLRVSFLVHLSLNS